MRQGDAMGRPGARRGTGRARAARPGVEGLEVRALLATFLVTNAGDGSASGSLRAAIVGSNGSAGSNTIHFAIPGAGVHTIAITSALPALAQAVTIDGTSQAGYAGTPLIELNGVGAGSGVDGLDVQGGASTIEGLAINRFTGSGIVLSKAGADQVVQDFLGLDPTGTVAEGNGNDGVLVQAASNGNVISGDVISGNTSNGVELNGQSFGAANQSTSGNLVAGNRLGTDLTGTVALGNHNDGVYVQNAPLTTIGGTTAAARDIISGNGSGLELYDNSDGTVVEGNYVGTDATGEIGLGNNGASGFFHDGLVFRGVSNSTIGGTAAGAGNVISGGSNYGIDSFVIGSSNLAIQGNLIGTDAAGTKALPNKVCGVNVNGPTNVTIGGSVAGARNVISGNGVNGIAGSGDGIQANGPGLIIEGNDIGVGIDGVSPLGNGGDGISVNGSGVTVGGPDQADGNIIANNGFVEAFDHSGVKVQTETATILSNSIYGNKNLGIEVDPTPLPAAPAITSAGSVGATSTVVGTFSAATAAVGTYTLQFFSTPGLNASGNAEGETLLGTATLTTDATGSGTFSATLPASLASGQLVTATATGPSGVTSPFSKGVAATTTTIVPSTTHSTLTVSPAAATFGQPVTLTVTVTAGLGSPTPSGLITFSDFSRVLGTAPLDATGHATFSTAGLPLGTQSISATYAGDPGHKASAASAGSLYVGDLPKDDFDGDGKADLAVFGPNPLTGRYGFTILTSSSGSKTTVTFDNNGYGYGGAGSIPVIGDYFGDGKAAYALWTPNNLGGMTFTAVSSVNSKGVTANFGGVGMTPVVADVDGDGKADFGVYGLFPGHGYGFDFLLSSDGFNVLQQSFFNNNGYGYGNAQSIPVVADFDGTGRAGYGLFNPAAAGSTFTFIDPANNVSFSRIVGTANDVPTAVDFDGDGKADLALYGLDPAKAGHERYLVLTSSTGYAPAQAVTFDNFGYGYGDAYSIPVIADYEGTGHADFGLFTPDFAGGTDYLYQTSQTGAGVVVDFPTTTELPLTASPYLLAKKVRGH